jgi:hypothetical protein
MALVHMNYLDLSQEPKIDSEVLQAYLQQHQLEHGNTIARLYFPGFLVCKRMEDICVIDGL